MDEDLEAALMRAGAQIAALQMELTQVRAYANTLNERCIADTPDAERYRWLRGNGWAESAIYATGPKECGANGVALLCGDQLDGVIDGAIGAA